MARLSSTLGNFRTISSNSDFVVPSLAIMIIGLCVTVAVHVEDEVLDVMVVVIVGLSVGVTGGSGSPGVVAVSRRLSRRTPRVRNRPVAGTTIEPVKTAGAPTAILYKFRPRG